MSGAVLRRSALAVGILATTLGATGCGVVLDLTYLIGSKRYNETAEERRPTGQVNTAIEYDALVSPDGQARLVCEQRERTIDRTWTVEKTFQRRGSYDASTYMGAATISGLAAVITGVVIGVICVQHAQDPTVDKKVSCLNMLYATPMALDVGWSIYRAASAKPAKLVDKHKSEGQLAFAPNPIRKTPLPCDSVKQLMLGQFFGASDETILNGNGGGQAQRLNEGARTVAIAGDGAIALAMQPDAVRAWAENESNRLWVVDQEDQTRPVNVDRCTVLRAILPKTAPPEQMAILKACQQPPAPNPR